MSLRLDEHKISRLIHTGKKNGFLNLDDVLIEFKEVDLGVEQIEALCNIFGDLGITIYRQDEEGFVSIDEKIFSEAVEDLDNDDAGDEIAVREDESLTNNSLKIFLYEMGKIPLLSQEQEYELAKQASNGDSYAKELLIISNMRLVVNVAKKYQGRGVQIDDLIPSGYFGLRKAIEKFDYTKGFKLSTYATWWIRQSITRDIGDNGRSVRIPIHIIELINKYNKTQLELTQEFGKEPTDTEIAKRMGITADKIDELRKHMTEGPSIDRDSGRDDDGSGSWLPPDTNQTPGKIIKQKDMNNAIEEILNTLPEKEANVIRIRYGLLDGKPKTLEETGNYFKITRERVRQIENKAIRKLKHPSKSGLLKELLNYDF